MSAKTFLCRCEDLTVDDCLGAIGDGYTAFEDLKRFLGVGTGPCQGKACVQAAIHLIAEARGISPDHVDVMTFRPPVRPIPFATLAAVEGRADGAEEQDRPAPGTATGGGQERAGPDAGSGAGDADSDAGDGADAARRDALSNGRPDELGERP